MGEGCDFDSGRPLSGEESYDPLTTGGLARAGLPAH